MLTCVLAVQWGEGGGELKEKRREGEEKKDRGEKESAFPGILPGPSPLCVIVYLLCLVVVFTLLVEHILFVGGVPGRDSGLSSSGQNNSPLLYFIPFCLLDWCYL